MQDWDFERMLGCPKQAERRQESNLNPAEETHAKDVKHAKEETGI